MYLQSLRHAGARKCALYAQDKNDAKSTELKARGAKPMWQSLLRKAGYDPALVRDATGKLEAGEVTKQDLNGSIVGDPCNCCGAKLLRRTLDAEMAWVGARFAIVVYHKKRILRFRHNGGIPSQFDRGFFPLGTPLRLNPPSKHEKLGIREPSREGEPRKRPYQKRFPSLVGQFRR
jgi:hypothetical protein